MIRRIGLARARLAPPFGRAADGQRIVSIFMPRCSTGAILALAMGASGLEWLHRLFGFGLGHADGIEERLLALVRSHHHAFSRD
jgi:hypothetical protein